MIDSAIWKDKLEQEVTILHKRQMQRRWSDRSIVLFERELMLIFFSVRALIEAGKLTNRVNQKKYSLTTYPNKGKIVDDITKYDIDQIFDFDSGIEKKFTIKMLTHQFIHSYVIFTEFSEDGKLMGVLLCSDWEKMNNLIQLPIFLAIKIIEDVIGDEIQEIQMVRNEKTDELRKVKIT